ncbi:MAG TPA: DHA2 family efflux MFS transporter permease subunit [Aestuariivirga sp.]
MNKTVPKVQAAIFLPEAKVQSNWLGFLAMCIGMFMAILDIQIVVTSLPAISTALNIPASSMSWVQTVYLVAEIIAIPMTGYLTRALSMRGLFLWAISIFTLASFACAMAPSLAPLMAARIFQGFAGGCLIPLVFSAVFLLFPPDRQSLPTTLAGGLAVLAPTLGPTVGGYITQTYSWHWLFMVNVLPGIMALAIALANLRKDVANHSLLRLVDWVSVLLMMVGLTSFQVAMKEGPAEGWLSLPIVCLFLTFVLCLIVFIFRSVTLPNPLTRLQLLRERNFATAAIVSFAFGIGLFATVYLMSVFLGIVRHHSPLEIGIVMLVTGVTQLIVSPLVVFLDRHFDARLLTFIGLVIFGSGLAISSWESGNADFHEMILPQVLRGTGIMFCLIPPTRLALSGLPEEMIPDGSALFNLMRNLGGAVGIALVDTVIWQRSPKLAAEAAMKLAAGDTATANAIGLPFPLPPAGLIKLDGPEIELVRPYLETYALTGAINEAWFLLAAVTFAALFALPLSRPNIAFRS